MNKPANTLLYKVRSASTSGFLNLPMDTLVKKPAQAAAVAAADGLSRKAQRAFAAAALTAALGAGFLMAGCSFNPEEAVNNAVNQAANAALDASGVKDLVADSLNENAAAIASAVGVDEAVVQEAIQNLDIASWSVATLPSAATEVATFATEYNETPLSITTYDDPGYVTLEALGQSVTMAIPETAQQYATLLQYVSAP